MYYRIYIFNFLCLQMIITLQLFTIWKMKKSSILAKSIGKTVFIIKTESSPLTSISIFSTISQILKTTFYVFLTQTRKNLKSIKIASSPCPQITYLRPCLTYPIPTLPTLFFALHISTIIEISS